MTHPPRGRKRKLLLVLAVGLASALGPGCVVAQALADASILGHEYVFPLLLPPTAPPGHPPAWPGTHPISLGPGECGGMPLT